jgi:hypothetical protein
MNTKRMEREIRKDLIARLDHAIPVGSRSKQFNGAGPRAVGIHGRSLLNVLSDCIGHVKHLHLNAASDLVDNRACTCTANDRADAADMSIKPAMSSDKLSDIDSMSSANPTDSCFQLQDGSVSDFRITSGASSPCTDSHADTAHAPADEAESNDVLKALLVDCENLMRISHRPAWIVKLLRELQQERERALVTAKRIALIKTELLTVVESEKGAQRRKVRPGEDNPLQVATESDGAYNKQQEQEIESFSFPQGAEWLDFYARDACSDIFRGMKT